MRVVLGEDYKLQETKYKEAVPTCTQFVVYEFKKDNRQNSFYMLFHCKF